MPLVASNTSSAGAAARNAPQQANAPPEPAGEQLTIEMLGAGNEVGRSCCVLKYKGKTVVCDAGVHPAYTGIAALPFIDELDWSTVDALLITHFHLDHAAALTYVMEKTNFKDGKGKVYMTHPTKAVYRFLMSDFVRISNAGSDDRLFDETEMLASWRQIEAVDFHQEVTVGGGLRFTPYHAGHVLGACMYLIEIAGLRILYTGDFSREEDRHLVQAEIPPVRPDVLICESTYGVQSLEPRLDKEQRFTTMIHNIVSRGGRVLLPVFVLGRAQELLLLLDEYWSAHPELQRIPIYYASSLARKCIGIYQTYIHTMNEHIRSRFNRRDNPFVFKHVSNLRSLDKFEDKGPCVMMASPGFMQSGVSRELLERWAPDRRNGLIVTGYSVEGTMARSILNEPDEIISVQGQKIPRRMTVDYISFSAHVDYAQNSKFIDEIKAQHIVLVHGEATAMARLRAALNSKYSERVEDVKIHTPRNCEPLKLHFRGERLATAIGSLAEKTPEAGSILSGLLVSKDFAYTILDPKDLAEFTGLSTSTIIQRQRVALNVSWDLARWHIEGMYGSVLEGVDVEGRRTMRVMNSVDVKQSDTHELLLEWVSSVNNDMIADSALALLLGIDSSPASVRMSTRPCSHSHEGGDEGEHKHKHIVDADGKAAGHGTANGSAAVDAADATPRSLLAQCRDGPHPRDPAKHPFAESKSTAAKKIERVAQIAAFLEAYYGEVEEVTIGKSPEEEQREREREEQQQQREHEREQEAEAEVEAAKAKDEETGDAETTATGDAVESGADPQVKVEPTEDDHPALGDEDVADDGKSAVKAEAQDAAMHEAGETAAAGGPTAQVSGPPTGPSGASNSNNNSSRSRRRRRRGGGGSGGGGGGGYGGGAGQGQRDREGTPPPYETTITGPLRQGLKVTLDDKVAIVDLQITDFSQLANEDGDGDEAEADFSPLIVYSQSDVLRKRVLHLVALADRTGRSLNDSFGDRFEGEGGKEMMCSQLFLGAHSDVGVGDGGKRLEGGDAEQADTATATKRLKVEA